MAKKIGVLVALVCVMGTSNSPQGIDVEAAVVGDGPLAFSELGPLTSEELAWIEEHPTIRLGVDPEFAPFEFIADDGSYSGMAADYVDLLNERLGLGMAVWHKTSWAVASDLAGTGDVDVLPCVGKTAERERRFLFTDSYLTFYRVIVSREDGPKITGLSDLRDLQVAVQANSSHEGYLLESSEVVPRSYATVEETLASVSGGETDAAVVNVATASYWIRKLGLSNLQVASRVGEGNRLYFAVRRDWPELVSILNKGLATVTEEEAAAIRERWVEVAVVPGVDWGRILRWSSVFVGAASLALIFLALHNRALRREITTRRHAEAALRERESDYRMLVEGADVAILRMTPDGTVVFVNRFAERFFGYSSSEIVGKNVMGTIVPESESRGRDLRGLLADLAAYPERYEANENENMTKSGERVWVAWTNRPIYACDGSLREILCVGTDLTARKRADEALSRYEFIANTVDDMMSVLDREGRYEAANTAWCSLIGKERSDVIGKRLEEVWPAEVAEQQIAPLLHRCIAGEVVSQESVLRLPTRGERHCEVTMYPYHNVTGTVTHAVVVTHDVTEWRTAQAALHDAKHAAEAANRAKSTFLANMSHEIRTPMNAILGYAQLLRRYEELGPESEHALHAIARSGEHLLELINDVLEMSKIEAGRAELHPTTFNLRGLLSDIEAMFVLRTNAKGLRLSIEVGSDVPTYIRGDEARVRQVLINLLGNAVKFTDHGQVAVRVSVAGGGDSLAIEVDDTGCGIAPGEVESIFESFQQAGVPELRRGGTGLGLPISRTFARMMGGDLIVESTVGAGSLFRFSMKVEAGDAGEARERELERRVRALRAGQGEVRVLVIDDRATNRDLLCRILDKVGFATRETENGQDGLAVFAAWRPQIVLVDMVMPVMRGRDVVRALRARPEGREAAILAVTASTLDEELVEIVALGADAVLRKPFRESELFALIHRYAQVEFDYESEATSGEGDGVGELTSAGASYERLPAVERERLRRAVVTGSIDGVNRFAADVRSNAPDLAEVIEKCARAFALDELEALMSGWETTHE